VSDVAEQSIFTSQIPTRSVVSLPWTIPDRQRLLRWTENAWRITALPLVLLFLIPIVMLFARTSPQALLDNIARKTVIQAVGISLRTTLVSLSLILLLGTPLGYLMGRHQFRYKKALDTLIDLPTVLPPSVAGVALLMTLGRKGLIGGWLDRLGIELAFSMAAVAIAQMFVAAPFYVRAATLGFAGIDVEIEQAAQLDGASRWQIFRHLILPLSRYALIGGAMMSWARALGEFGATMIFAGNFPGRTQTMPLAIYIGFERDLNSALTLSVILVVVSFLSLLIIRILISHETEGV
jgi:molybdate transport system permease protein